jgi:heme-degrading monooxygenase HmoA
LGSWFNESCQSSIAFQPAEYIINTIVYSLTGGNTMIARVSNFQAKVNKLDDFKKAFDKEILQDAKLRKGFRGGYLLIDRKTGNSLSIGFWDSEQDALADEQSGQFQTRTNMGKDFYVAPPVREIYEVSSKF